MKDVGTKHRPASAMKIDSGREELYEGLVECASDLITVVDGEGLFLFVNSRAADVFGLTPEECVGRRAFSFIHPDDVDRTEAWFSQCIADRAPSGTIENRQISTDGSVREVLWSGVFHYDADGSFVRADGAARDLTGLRQAQRELEHRLGLLEDAQSIARLGYYVYDSRSGKWDSSPILDEILGIDGSFPRDVPGWLSLVHPEDRDRVAAIIEQDLHGDEGPPENAYRIVRNSDGETRWIQSLGRLDRDPALGLLRITGTVRDITEQRLAEERLKDAKDALRDHATLLEEAQSVANLGYYDYDAVLGTWTSSPIMNSIFGIDESFERTVDTWLSIVHVDDQPMMAEYLAQVFARQGSFDHSYRITRIDDGKTRWVHGLGRITYDDSGAPLRMFGTITDITERKLLEDELALQKKRIAELAIRVLDRSEQERRALAAELHDGVIQVLAAAKMWGGQLAHNEVGAPDNACAEKLLELLGAAITDLRALTTELSHPVLRESGLGPALYWLADSDEQRFGLHCEMDIHPSCRERRDRSAAVLYRTIRELLNNVTKHSGTDSARVVVSSDHNTLTAEVTDTGCGFDPTVAPDPPQYGEHFGLTDVREELELTGGSLSIESAPGHGTRVTVRVPSRLRDD